MKNLFSDILRGLLMAFQRDIDDNEDPLCLFVAQIKFFLQTFSVARPSRFISYQGSDFLSYFLQLLLDFLTVWSGVEAVAVIIHITTSGLRRFYCRVGKCRDETSEPDNSKEMIILTPQYEPFWDSKELSYMYNGQSVREEMILKLPQILRIASDFSKQDFSRLCIFSEGFRHLLLRSPIKL